MGRLDIILASDVYAKHVGAEDPDYKPLFGDPMTRPIKGGELLDIVNIYGNWKSDALKRDITVGVEEMPGIKPHLLRDHLLRKGRDGKKPLVECVAAFHDERLKFIEAMIPVRHDKVTRVNSTLARLSSLKHASMELTSLIDPRSWATDPDWKSYETLIHRIANSAKDSIFRRLHVISQEHFQRQMTSDIIGLMVAECMSGLRPRLFQVEEKKVTRTPYGGFKCGDFALFDCGTSYSPGREYMVIYSDLKPYFLMGDEDRVKFKDFSLHCFRAENDSYCIYEELRANFFRGWHNQENTLTLPNAISRVVELDWTPDSLEPNNITRFLPRFDRSVLPNDPTSTWYRSVVGIITKSTLTEDDCCTALRALSPAEAAKEAGK